MAFWLGSFVGAGVAVLFLSWIIEAVAKPIRRQPPSPRAFWAVGLAWLIAGGVAQVLMSPDSRFGVPAHFFYLPGAAVVLLWRRHSLQKAWDEDSSDASVFE